MQGKSCLSTVDVSPGNICRPLANHLVCPEATFAGPLPTSMYVDEVEKDWQAQHQLGSFAALLLLAALPTFAAFISCCYGNSFLPVSRGTTAGVLGWTVMMPTRCRH